MPTLQAHAAEVMDGAVMGPWDWDGPPSNIHVFERDRPHMRVCFLTSDGPTEARARLIAAAPDLLAAIELSERSELEHANCAECGGEGEAEACEACFPLADDARFARRAAIAKAEGRS